MPIYAFFYYNVLSYKSLLEYDDGSKHSYLILVNWKSTIVACKAISKTELILVSCGWIQIAKAKHPSVYGSQMIHIF